LEGPERIGNCSNDLESVRMSLGGLREIRRVDTAIYKTCRWGGENNPLRQAKYLMRISEIIKPPTADQARIKALSAAQKRAADALKAERERQKRAKGLEMLRSTYP